MTERGRVKTDGQPMSEAEFDEAFDIQLVDEPLPPREEGEPRWKYVIESEWLGDRSRIISVKRLY